MRTAVTGGVALASRQAPQLARTQRRPLAAPALVRLGEHLVDLQRTDGLRCSSLPRLRVGGLRSAVL